MNRMKTLKRIMVVLVVGSLLGVFFFDLFPVSGESMKPTIENGSSVLIHPDSAEIGDIVVFECYSSECRYPGDNGGVLIKRVTQKQGNCFYLEGDNRLKSWDSRSYGWLCDDDLKILGKVVWIFQ